MLFSQGHLLIVFLTETPTWPTASLLSLTLTPGGNQVKAVSVGQVGEGVMEVQLLSKDLDIKCVKYIANF